MAAIFFLAWDEERPNPIDYYDDPDPCPICGGLGWIEWDEEHDQECKCMTGYPYDVEEEPYQ